MPQLLLEFFSEEIPARMQKRAEEDLARAFGEAMAAAGFAKLTMRTLSGPRRIALIVDDLPGATPDVNEERKGPKVGAPEQALAGFMRAAGLSKIEDAQIQKDPKGDFYVARISKTGRETAALIAEIVPKIAREFPWPKSMRSGSSDFIWVRPLHKVLCVFDGKPVRFEIGGVQSGDQTEGHRFHAPAWISVKNAAEYEAKLKAAFVLTDREARKAKILADAKAACAAKQLELVEDAALLEEVAGLSEWPVVVLGDMDPAFLDLPAEVIRLTMRTHQRYFAVKSRDGKLAPHFITIANIEAKDGGKAIAAGNARVLSARLNDARFFWDNDKKIPLEQRTEKLKQIVFHQKLGSVWDKVERVRALAKELAPIVGADPMLVDRAALLMKADLVTETVGEFPELQGQIGRQLFLLQNGLSVDGSTSPPPRGEGQGRWEPRLDGMQVNGLAPSRSTSPPTPGPSPRGGGEAPLPASAVQSIALAIEDHYRPVGPNDRVPSDPVALAVALADKLDTLVGFWAIDEKPTGSRDPYALRRAAIGFLRILLDHSISADFVMLMGRPMIDQVMSAHDLPREATLQRVTADLRSLDAEREALGVRVTIGQRYLDDFQKNPKYLDEIVHKIGALRDFLIERLEVVLKDTGATHDLVAASMFIWTPPVQVKGGPAFDFLPDTDVCRISARLSALEAFLKTDDGATLLAGYRRAANILKAEEKKDAALAAALAEPGALDTAKLTLPAERVLLAGLEEAGAAAKAAVEAEKFEAAMAALAKLRAPLDKFFEDVLVNDPDPGLRKARLMLLARIRDALHQVADFSKIEG